MGEARRNLHITHLSLTNFRNYAHLKLDIPSRHIVIQGDNAQGKTNLLEAMHILSTTKSFRASNEREIINWAAFKTETPTARIFANVQREKNEVKVPNMKEISQLISKARYLQSEISLHSKNNLADGMGLADFAILNKIHNIKYIDLEGISGMSKSTLQRKVNDYIIQLKQKI